MVYKFTKKCDSKGRACRVAIVDVETGAGKNGPGKNGPGKNGPEKKGPGKNGPR